MIVTGVASKDFIKKHAAIAEEYCEGLKIYVEGIENEFFGKTVTCTGLIVGKDVINFVKAFDKPFDELAVSSAMLNYEKTLFLDDVTVDELQKAIKKPVRILPCGGDGFFDGLTRDV